MRRYADGGSQVSDVRAASILGAPVVLLLQDPFGGFATSPPLADTGSQPLRTGLQALAARRGPDLNSATGSGGPDSVNPRGLVFELENCEQIFPSG